MIDTTEFLVHARLEAELLEAWIEAGWLLPRRDVDVRRFSEIDLARARLIRDLKEDLGVNDEGTAVILDLVDQMHGLRRALRGLCSPTTPAGPTPRSEAALNIVYPYHWSWAVASHHRV